MTESKYFAYHPPSRVCFSFLLLRSNNTLIASKSGIQPELRALDGTGFVSGDTTEP